MSEETPNEGQETPAATPDTAAAETGEADVASPARPEIPEAYRTETGDADISKLLARVAEVDAANSEGGEEAKEGEDGEDGNDAEKPETPDDYSVDLTEDVKLVGGQTISFDANDPLVKEFAAKAHDLGLNQEQFSDLLTMGAKALAGNLDNQVSVTQAQVKEQIEKLGKTPEEQEKRFGNLFASLSRYGTEEGAYALMTDVRQFESFAFLEKLIEQVNTSGGGRTPVLNGAIREQKPLEERLFSQSTK